VNHVFPDTPSGGRVEARAGLLRAGARGARSRTLRALQRFFPVRRRADVEAVLDELVTDGDAEEPTAGSYRLTDQGLDKARHHPNPRYMAQR
jgi:hypothetical protein